MLSCCCSFNVVVLFCCVLLFAVPIFDLEFVGVQRARSEVSYTTPDISMEDGHNIMFIHSLD
jgi:hypothetical protein